MINISTAVEGDYVPHSAAMLHSVLQRLPGEAAHVHYLYGPDCDLESRDHLESMVTGLGAEISFIHIPDERVAGLPTKGFTGKATWYRIFLPELLPDVDRLLYLDADLLAMDNLTPLWREPLDGFYIAAVTNVLQHNHLHRPEALGLSAPEEYFNAGVLLMNLDLMRRDSSSSALLEYGVANAGNKRLLEWRDQDALNVVLGKRRRPLHPRWNCTNAVLKFERSNEVFGTAAVEEARTAPAIRHFEGPAFNKPWHYLSPPDAQAAYTEHRRATPWPKVRVDGRTPGNVLKRLRSRLRA